MSSDQIRKGLQVCYKYLFEVKSGLGTYKHGCIKLQLNAAGGGKQIRSVGNNIRVLANFPYFGAKIVNFSHFSKNYSLKMQ